jgi:hypothetical protein
MRFYVFRNWLLKELKVSKRLQRIILWYVISLMIITRKHSLENASAISGKNSSQFSRLLKDHPDTAIYTLKDLSKRQGKKYSKALEALKGLPWKAAVIVDLTGQGRSSLHSENVQKLNHGNGYFVGHQWTNIVLLINGMIIPLPPIAFLSRKYCREKNLEYKTEHKRVIDYLKDLDLRDYIDDYKPKEVVVLADSGYDDKRIQNVIRQRGWDFIMAVKRRRSVKSTNAQYFDTNPEKGWSQIQAFFETERRLMWETVRLSMNGAKRRRKEFRVRHTRGWLKNVGRVQLVCSERKRAPRAERKYFACSHLTLQPKQILIGYSLRWAVELFHKAVKMHLGFEDVAATSFDSVTAHVHWVYCAYILLHAKLPGVPSSARALYERQSYVMRVVEHKEKANLFQRLTQINGFEKHKNQSKEALAA